jgi:hypothetical protein
MTFRAALLGSGTPNLQAQAIVGTITTGLTATGSTQATALNLLDTINVIGTTAASTGVVAFPVPNQNASGDTCTVYNFGANTLTVYPPVGYKINNGSTNAGVSVAAGKGAVLTLLDTVNIGAIISA